MLLNLLWEAAQLPFYAFAPTYGPLQIAWSVVHCTAGAVAIALGAYAAAALVTRDREWPTRRPSLGLPVALAVGVAWTVLSEWLNVHVRGAWTYAPTMPTFAGVGMMPLLQWLAIPPVVLFALRHRMRTHVTTQHWETSR